MITLATLPEATAQEVFDQSAIHLLTQNKKSSSYVPKKADGICKYRLGDLKCAAGCFISDEEYNSSFEGKSWTTLHKEKLVPSNHYLLIKDLQEIHDEYSPDKWKELLKNLAEYEDLTFDNVELNFKV
jgi:hypothetical protein